MSLASAYAIASVVPNPESDSYAMSATRVGDAIRRTSLTCHSSGERLLAAAASNTRPEADLDDTTAPLAVGDPNIDGWAASQTRHPASGNLSSAHDSSRHRQVSDGADGVDNALVANTRTDSLDDIGSAWNWLAFSGEATDPQSTDSTDLSV